VGYEQALVLKHSARFGMYTRFLPPLISSILQNCKNHVAQNIDGSLQQQPQRNIPA
jgi:hypothetical protein